VTATLAWELTLTAGSIHQIEETCMASRRTPDSTPSSQPTKPAAKPAARKAAAKPAPVTTPPVAATDVTEPAKSAPARQQATASKAKARPEVGMRRAITEDMRRGMIAEGAYLRAERRGFAPGHEEEDWLAAEAEVDHLLSADSKMAQ
jgi:hypothetical protein